MFNAIAAGKLFVAAAGNAQIPGDGGLNADDFPVYPAAYDLSNILSVAALDRNDQLWSDSYFGQTSVDLGAPGVTINSTIGGSYGTLTGTSMAAPQVTGAAALLLAENPGLSRSELKSRLLSNVIPIPALDGKTSTGGKLNLLELFMPDPAPPARVEDLTVIDIGADYIQLSLTATGDDGNYGQASAYEVRFHPLPLTEANFYAGFPVEVSSPAPARSSDVIILNGLNPSINYYIALRVVDDKGNKSPVSNSVSATTEAVGEGFSDDMESGSNQWIADGFWHLSSRPGRYGSPSNAFLYGQENPLAPAIPPNYNDGGINQGSLTSRPFLLTGFETPILRFSYFKHTESNSARDTTSVMIITDSGTDTLRTTLANNLGPLVVEEIDLLAYKNQMVRLKFHFDTVDQYLNNYEGWYIDDVEIFDAGDTTPPSPPGNFTALGVQENQILLAWFRSGDDGIENGPASSYDLRYSTSLISTNTHFENANELSGLPSPPGPSGGVEYHTVKDLLPDTLYFFALKILDEVPNASPFSMLMVRTLPAAL